MKAIGIDIGTTTISAVVLDEENQKVIEARTIQNGSFIKTDKEWERIQDVSVILKKAVQVLDEYLDSYEGVESIGLTGQMHGIVYLDENGHHVSPLYTWQDGRGNLPVSGEHSLTEELYRKYGVRVSTGYGLVTHIYNVRMGLVPEKAVSLCTIPDCLGMALTGRKRPLIHISNAASLGCYDAAENGFMTEMLADCGVNPDILPEVTAEFSVLGHYKGIPVTAALGDNQASFLGSVGIKEHTLLLNMGTGGQISVLSDQYYEAPGIEARPFVKDKYLLVGSSLCGGRAYAILERFLRSYAKAAGAEDRAQYDVMEKLAEEGSSSKSSLTVVTAFKGTRAEPSLRGSITGIDEDNFTPENLVCGVLYGMAGELYGMYRQIYEGTGIPAEHLIASGNGLRKNKVLQQIFCKMFESDLELAVYEEEAACGAAVSSSMRTGRQILEE